MRSTGSKSRQYHYRRGDAAQDRAGQGEQRGGADQARTLPAAPELSRSAARAESGSRGKRTISGSGEELSV